MTIQLVLILFAIFGSVALVGGLLASTLLTWSTPEQREIRRLSQRGSSVLAQLQLSDTPAPWIKRFQQLVPKSPKDMSRLRRRLGTAGYRSLTTAVLYGSAETLLPFVAGGIGRTYFGFSHWSCALMSSRLGFVWRRVSSGVHRACAAPR